MSWYARARGGGNAKLGFDIGVSRLPPAVANDENAGWDVFAADGRGMDSRLRQTFA